MTDKKLTDEEIIKRLERCVKRGNRNYDTDIVLDLINRQNAEIVRLKYLLDEEEKKYTICAKHFYKEAIKEFAERLKGKAMQKFDWNEYVEVEDIDNLVKEMMRER